MNRLILASLIAISTTLTACAGMPPSKAEIAKAPQIQFGQPLPQGDNYVLHFPAGTPLPVTTKVDGSRFEHDSQATFNVTLKREVFLYRKFASFDGQNWKPGYKLIKTQLELQIPQHDGSQAGMLHIQMDQN